MSLRGSPSSNQAGAGDLARLVVVSVALGSGRGVFAAESQRSRLRPIRNETLGGLVAADYAVVSAAHG